MLTHYDKLMAKAVKLANQETIRCYPLEPMWDTAFLTVCSPWTCVTR